MNDSNVVLNARALCKGFSESGQKIQILDHVDLQVVRGERVAIIGSSGSGKSTLLNILGGLDSPDEGDVHINGQSLYEVGEGVRSRIRNHEIGFVYQFHHLLHEFTALENVAMPLLIGKVPVAEARARAETLLQQVGLGQRLAHKPSKLSGGERQRVAIARALITQPACVLMDEPTGNLDRRTAEEIEQCINDLNAEFGIAVVTVTHDNALAARMDRQLLLQDGALAVAAEL